MGQPSRINLDELGPGQGTLMADHLRVCALIFTSISYLNLFTLPRSLEGLCCFSVGVQELYRLLAFTLGRIMLRKIQG